MNRLTTCYELTKQLKQVLDQSITPANRESIINEVNDLVQKREKVMKQITPPFTEAEKELGKQVVLLNEPIQQKMQTIFAALKKDMQQIKKQKRSNESYTNPYEGVHTMDGMFLDNKL